MLCYRKGTEPQVLTTLRTTPGATWDSPGKAEKDDIREALLRDQRHLCCYCQRRIPATGAQAPGMKIEHWDARGAGGEAFVWTNLLGVCLGDRIKECAEPTADTLGQDRLHCDTSRGDAALFLHPVDGQGPNPREFLRYSGDGLISSDNLKAQFDVDKTLNLNALHLQRGRKQVLDALKTRLGRKKSWTARGLRNQLENLEKRAKASEHIELSMYFLKRWLNKKS